MARLMLVANPAASQFTGGDHRQILRLLTRRHMVEAVWPKSAIDARAIASDAVTAGFDGVVAMGGDGIVHQVAQSLVGTDVYLAILPAGTTNVLARQMGLPSRATKAARLLTGDVALSRWPVVEVEAMTASGDLVVHHALFAVGVGLDADVVAAAESEPYRKYRFGGIHYARTAIRMLWSDIRRRAPSLEVRSGDRMIRAVGAMVQFREAFTYFGRWPLRFASDAPGEMTVLSIERLPMRRLPGLLRRIAAGSIDRTPGLYVWRGIGSLSVTADPPARVETDGEVIGTVTSAHFAYRPEALWVVGPQAD
ncbi:MAG: diacylglycerol/lipid kinase family protein [Actinomycetota bacterium]